MSPEAAAASSGAQAPSQARSALCRGHQLAFIDANLSSQTRRRGWNLSVAALPRPLNCTPVLIKLRRARRDGEYSGFAQRRFQVHSHAKCRQVLPPSLPLSLYLSPLDASCRRSFASNVSTENRVCYFFANVLVT